MVPRVTFRLAMLCGALMAIGKAMGQQELGNSPEPTIRDLQLQLEVQAEEIRQLQNQIVSQSVPTVPSWVADEVSCTPEMKEQVTLVAELPWDAPCDPGNSASKAQKLNFFTDYDRGFVIRPFDAEEHPFEVQLNGWIQFRHHGFARNVETWTDNSGVTRPVLNRNAFDVERARLTMAGYAVDPRLTYFLQLDGDTDGADTVDFFDYWWGWQFTDRFKVELGKRKVPAGLQWLLGARRTRFIDRPMADDFFRPDRTVGIFGVGEFGQNGHYELMLGNGFRTANLPNSLTDDQLTIAATTYLEPAGPFGLQIVDFEGTSKPLWRVGHSFVFSPQAGDRLGLSLAESDFLRLSDGTRLTEIGALAPGVTVSGYDLFLYGMELACKYRGWSMTSEVFLRWVNDLRADGPLPVQELRENGFYVEGGKFLIASKLDWNVRYSQVGGEFGTASEYAAGLNWYPLAKPSLKISFDVTQLDGSPLQNPTSDILVGDSGTLFRSQFQAEF